MGKSILVVTGDIGSGKTKALQNLVERWHASEGRYGLQGLLSPAVFKSGNKVAIDLLDIHSRQRKQLAVLRDNKIEGPFTQRWSFHKTTIDWANNTLRQMPACQLFIIDELGPLELEKASGFVAALQKINSDDYKVAIAVVRPSLIEAFSKRWPVIKIIKTHNFEKYQAAGAARFSMARSILDKEIS